MPATGQAAIDLKTFDASEKMAEIRNIIQVSEEVGNIATIFAYESLGDSRETLFICTLLRNDGHRVEYRKDMIIVKSRKENEHAEN
ncbi:hypothetical protein [Planococcus sp. YIM B11945]|uniref:hypothetical protein n=1 Tax=Planococcus sp. YIM B11945 TaxID=3435410 RepID=UPI003D7E2894